MENQTIENEEFLAKVIDAVNQVLTTGFIPTDLPATMADNQEFIALLADLCGIYQFTLELANGELESEYKISGKIAGALKSLQANLRHLTWQTQQIAWGDFNQRVEFMADFSEAFNAIVQKLKEFQEAEDKRANHLHNQKQSAIKSLLDAKTSRIESEKLSAQVNSLLDEIRGLQLLLREQAIRDQLTGLFNRRYLVETLERELARAQRGNYPVSVIMIDLDNFKKLNDLYGNRVGDLILESLGKMLLQKTRLGDIPCRYGGEEMVVVFPNMDMEMTAQRAEFLRKAFERSSINNAGLTIRTTFSAGVASFPHHATDMDSLLHCADIALDNAKKAGRNIVVVYHLD